MAKLRVMIVDPSLYNRMVLNDILVSNGYSVCCEVSNGFDALANYEKARPDVVIVEATMPDRDGVATIEALRSKHLDCRAVLMASAGQRGDVCQAMSAGAVDFIPKPINERRVLSVLKKL